MRYRDRKHAGEELAAEIVRTVPDLDGARSVVLGIPRGGVVVAEAVAGALGASLDVAIAGKIGAPHNRELAIGAVGERGAVWLNTELIDRLGVSPGFVDDEVERLRATLANRRAHYGGAPEPDVWAGRDIIVVDDGVATGATLVVALHVARAAEPARLICGVPVAPPSSIDRITEVCDVVVCPLVPRSFTAVGTWYRKFDQASHEDVVATLARHKHGHP